MRYCYIRDVLYSKLLDFRKIHNDHNGSDILTKTLMREKLEVVGSIAEMTDPSTWLVGDICWVRFPLKIRRIT